MIASIGTIADMIIHSLDYEKILKDKLHTHSLEYILKLLLEQSDLTVSELFTFNNKEKIEKIIKQEIDDNKAIDIKVKTKDKNRFAAIVMDIIQSKTFTPYKPSYDTLSNQMATRTHVLDTFNPSGYIESQTPPLNQSQSPVHQAPSYPYRVADDTIDPLYQPFHTPPPKQLEPTLNFDIDSGNFDELISLHTLDSLPISQNMEPSPQNLNNKLHFPLHHPQEIVSHSGSNHLANAFEKKMKEAIQKKTNSSQSPPSSKAVNTKKKLITQTNIHPQQQQKENTKPITQTLVIQEDHYEYNEEDEAPFIGMAAPQLDLTAVKNETEAPYHSGYPPHHDNYQAVPTPRAFNFQWDSSPRAQQSRTPVHSPPRISDNLLIQNALQGVAYYADKLDSLHSEYRRVYGEQQVLNEALQRLDPSVMDQTEYSHRCQSLRSRYYAMSQTLQALIIGIYEQFQKMKRSLNTRFEFELDISQRSQFDKFERYHDQFANTQRQLLVFGQQQTLQQQHHQKMYHQQYTVPPTPRDYQQRVQNASYNYNRNMQQQINSMTPRGPNASYNYRNYTVNTVKNYPQTTSAIPDRKFEWNMNSRSNTQNRPRTPRVGSSGNVCVKKSGDIPNMGYVYIGSRMSQLISHIALSDRDVTAHQERIENAICDILKSEKTFIGFDIVSYGSSQHKLFIKDYSDFDFCIRCKKLGLSHDEAIDYIASALSENTEFEEIGIVDSISKSVHGYYLNDIHHISFYDKASKRGVDLVLNNLPEIGSSRFIAAYESIDPRFALLCRVVKYWSRQRKINDRITGTLSTYALVLMVINFLQSRRVLPTLSIMVNDRKTGLSPWSTQDDYQINVQKYRDFASKNEEPHSRLLVNFFYFYAFKFNFNKDVVSVRTGTYLTKSEKKWDNENHWLCVENPFNSKANLTQNVDEKSLNRIWAEFKRAYSILCESYKIYEVCKLAE